MARTKKVKSAGRLGAGYGRRSRNKFVEVELKQHKKQLCPFCSALGVKRSSAGIWSCKKCGKNFASNSYYLAKSLPQNKVVKF